MDKNLARRVIDEIVKCNGALSAPEVVVVEMPDVIQRDAARKAILAAAAGASGSSKVVNERIECCKK
jgi:hypothetical protein